MKIFITSGTGEGRTDLSAFDAALFEAGIGDVNLLQLSSIIPPGVEVVENGSSVKSDFGDRLFAVYASHTEDQEGLSAWAGIGWRIAKDGSGKGLFVEHHAGSEDGVKELIDLTLDDMVKYRPDPYGEIHHVVVGIKCAGKPVCAVVAAAYQAVDWE